MTWLLYGANGFTGRLIAQEAIQRGHQPLLAGRSAGKLAPLAEQLDLPFVAFDLKDTSTLTELVRRSELVLLAAGPFMHTSQPMLEACLSVGVPYLDISGEVPVFEYTYAHDSQAHQKDICLISGCGFDVVPTDCLANIVAGQISHPDWLETAISLGTSSAGTAISALEMLPKGGLVRRKGELRPYRLGKSVRQMTFGQRKRTVIASPWGDLVSAYRSTGIPNITTYASFPPAMIQLMRLYGWSIPRFMSLSFNRRLLASLVKMKIHGPNENQRQRKKAYAWACVSNSDDDTAQATLQTCEGYRFTALSSVLCVEKVLAQHPTGALTPAQAFGNDFIFEIPGSEMINTGDRE